MRCLKDSEMDCIRLRSAIIKAILDTKANFAPSLPVIEGLLDPSSLRQYPLRSIKGCEVPMYTLSMITKSLLEKYTSVFDRSHQHTILLSKLLYWDPYMNLGRKIVEDIFNPSLQGIEVTAEFIDEFSERVDQWETIALNVFKFERSTISNISRKSSDPCHACKGMFHNFRSMEMLTFGRLRELFDSFSIFSGRDIIVSI